MLMLMPAKFFFITERSDVEVGIYNCPLPLNTWYGDAIKKIETIDSNVSGLGTVR